MRGHAGPDEGRYELKMLSGATLVMVAESLCVSVTCTCTGNTPFPGSGTHWAMNSMINLPGPSDVCGGNSNPP